ncbi:hypothetical protein FEI13_18615 [Halomonas urmiana]|uniref:Uncharacterized protein n=1 Tax=Halomonas urmiana TaxID=490901 RepID=A0A5R8M5H0_9GAMM|nr:hypothetical protein [Halomonas urmiana]TLF44794.1 hypothetical protein FEI13_18615 [Halomonas urmiana]
MSAKSLAKNLRDEVVYLRDQQSVQAIQCDELVAYLDRVLTSPDEEVDPVRMEQIRTELQSSVEDRKALQASSLEMFRSVITAGQNALRTALLMNGGATVALLAFLGKLTTENPDKLSTFAGSLMIFTFGVFITGLVSGFTYLSQWFYASKRDWCQMTGWFMNILCIVLGLAAYGAFIWGAIDAYTGFQGFA